MLLKEVAGRKTWEERGAHKFPNQDGFVRGGGGGRRETGGGGGAIPAAAGHLDSEGKRGAGGRTIG